MNKLYTLPKLQNVPSPKKETLQWITQFAAAYTQHSTKNGDFEYVAN